MRSVLARVLFGLSYLSAPPPQPMLFPPILSFPRKGGRDIKGERISDSYSPTENPEEPMFSSQGMLGGLPTLASKAASRSFRAFSCCQRAVTSRRMATAP